MEIRIPGTGRDGFPLGILSHGQIQDDPVVRGDLWRDLETQHRLLEGDRGRPAGRGLHIGDLVSLLDQGRLLVRRGDARTRDDLGLALLLQRRQFKVEQSAIGQTGNLEGQGAGGVGHRQVDVAA